VQQYTSKSAKVSICCYQRYSFSIYVCLGF